MPRLLLAVAIVAEVLTTTALRQSAGFAEGGWSVVAIAGYGVSFSFLPLTLRTMPPRVADAIWSGVGVVLVSGLAWSLDAQKRDAAAVAGMVLIVTGTIVLNLSSPVAAQ